jgi:hypothetical protein
MYIIGICFETSCCKTYRRGTVLLIPEGKRSRLQTSELVPIHVLYNKEFVWSAYVAYVNWTTYVRRTSADCLAVSRIKT